MRILLTEDDEAIRAFVWALDPPPRPEYGQDQNTAEWRCYLNQAAVVFHLRGACDRTVLMATIAQSAPPMMLVTPLSHSGTLISATPMTVTHKPYPTLVSNGGLFGDLIVGSTARFSPHAATANTMSCHIPGHQLFRESLWLLGVDPR